MTNLEKFAVATAASEKFEASLWALIHSIRMNWSREVDIYVYDLGLSERVVNTLQRAQNVFVRKVPPFCKHWRSHYTWKIWILKNMDADHFIWLDAGMFVLSSLESVAKKIRSEGLFFVPNYQNLADEAPISTIYASGLTYASVQNKSSISANIIGFNRWHQSYAIVEEAYNIALCEENIMATTPRHKHDQALLSCLLYKHYPDYVFYDGIMYAGWRSPAQSPGQQCWGQRRAIVSSDLLQLHLGSSTFRRFHPRDPNSHTPATIKLFRYIKGKLARIIRRGKIHGIR